MLNWLTRYAFVTEMLGFDGAGNLTESVLDIGCGPHGLACAAPRAGFVGLDVDFPGSVAPNMVAFRSVPGPLPFADAAFDTVVCLDVVEHVPSAERAGLVEELARVAARRVLVACPSNEHAWGQDVLRASYAQRGLPVPGWLNEHDEHGLPTPEEIRAACERPAGFSARELPMTNGLLATMMVVADMLPEFAPHAQREFQTERDGWLRTFQAARFGRSTRKGYVIERQSARTAIADPTDLLGTVWGAIRCPACAGPGLELQGGRSDGAPAACPACGHLVARDETRAFDLRPPVLSVPAEIPPAQPSPAPPSQPSPTRPPAAELAPISATAPIRLLLSADWEQPSEWLPVLATFVAADPDGRHALCVDATTTDLGIATLHEMLATVCEEIAGDREFGEIIILDVPFVADGIIRVRSADDVRRHLGIEPAATVVASPERVAAHAQAAKRLADRVLAIAQRRRFLDAPNPWTSREPLVTVRIATWRKPRLLVERAIPSVLGGSYRNVELLVCSDGPDPETAAAVASIKDPRLRYLEMPERPVYPEQRWSLWEIAGSYAANRMVAESRGSFVAPLCHDDAFTHDHIPALLAGMAETGGDFAYGQALMEHPAGPWYSVGSAPLAHGQVTHGACLYSGRLRHVPLDPECWILREPGDWNMIRRVTTLGAKACFVPRVVLTHFAERSIVDYEDTDVRDVEGFVADIERTGLSWLLDVPVRALEEVRF